MKIPTGNIVPLYTLFSKNGIVEPGQMKILVDHVYFNGANSIFVLGSTGEGLYFMEKPEQKAIVLKSVQETNDQWAQPLLVGAYGESPGEVAQDIEFILQYIKNPFLVVPPPVHKHLNLEEQKSHYSEIFDRVSHPIFLYNNPDRFGKTNLDPNLCAYLKKYSNFVGLKDSSESNSNKKEYLKHLDERCSISCGKEGSIGSFFKMIPQDSRKYAGMIPSISNVVNSFEKVWKQALAGKDDEMLETQKEINNFRNKIYHSEIGTGKAQRGGKYALYYLSKKYGGKEELSPLVSPELDRPMDPAIKHRIETTVDWCVENKHVNLKAFKKTQ